MTEDESVLMYEQDEEEPNVVRPCDNCGAMDMIIRDPRHLPTRSVFSYCHACGLTYSAFLISDGHDRP